MKVGDWVRARAGDTPWNCIAAVLREESVVLRHGAGVQSHDSVRQVLRVRKAGGRPLTEKH
jgi:hypothetical protein